MIFRQAATSLLEFQQAQQHKEGNQAVGTVERDLCQWRAPAAGQVKVNWDAAQNLKEGRMEIGVVIIDEGSYSVTVFSEEECEWSSSS